MTDSDQPDQPERIPVLLVVEDEPLLRMLAVDVGEDAGFLVVAAANADDAVAILESRGDIRLVFTDIDMPGSLDGMKLAACIRDRWPPIHIILTSGHMKPSEERHARGQHVLCQAVPAGPGDRCDAADGGVGIGRPAGSTFGVIDQP